MERSMLGVKLSDKLNNQKLRKRTGVSDALRQIIWLKWKWAGHVCRANTISWTKILTEWLPRNKKRKRGRPRKRWADVFTQVCGPLWMRNAKERREWRELGEAYAREATSTTTQQNK
ncbi:jg5453 [Pararge aegeria aegeria]|uniref:Jg5453 protein n=1 Tax=Pararge aegeria aegeria TaxID=348720 RepID=A0A8S4SJE4_9NEOP|nr:jg5453 [Pararge aegeria aegeria]